MSNNMQMFLVVFHSPMSPIRGDLRACGLCREEALPVEFGRKLQTKWPFPWLAIVSLESLA
jgi:hypothetical protein